MANLSPPKQTEYVEMITADLKTLGIVPDKVSFTSQYFDQIVDLAEKMISEGKAYVDPTPVNQVRANRFLVIFIFNLASYNRCNRSAS